MTADVRWRNGKGHRVPAELVAAKVIELRERYGVCPPSMFVEAASPDDSPLHDLFEWDDTIAGPKWRLQQAREIIRSVKVILHEQEKAAPMFVHVRLSTPEGTSDGYVETARAMSDAKMRQSVLADARRQLKGIRARYALFSELASVFAAIDKLDEG